MRALIFLDGMPNSALTSAVEPGSSADDRKFDITIRAGVLRENISEMLTAKERTCFEVGATGFTVSVEGGSMDAIVYVLLHEVTHLVDSVLGLTPENPPCGQQRACGPTEPPPNPPATPF